MSAADVGKLCPNCREAMPPGKRGHAVFCAPRCSKAAHVRGRRFAKRHLLARGKPPGEASVLMHAVRTAFLPGLTFSIADAVEAVRRWGTHLEARRVGEWFTDLVEAEYLAEAATADGGQVFWRPLPEPVPPSGAPSPASPKRGLHVAGGPSSNPVDVSVDGVDDARSVPTGTEYGSTVAVSGAVGGGAADHVQPPLAPEAPARDRRSRAARVTPDPGVKCIAPPQLDGGTSLRFQARSLGSKPWNQALRGLWAKRGQLHIVDADGVVLTARVMPGEAGGTSVIFDGEAQLDLFPNSGAAHLIMKKEALWLQGVRAWMDTWLTRAHFWLTGENLQVSEAGASGWRVRSLEIAADFTGLYFYACDVGNWTGKGKKPGLTYGEGAGPNGEVETIDCGKRRKNALCVSSHDKTKAVEADGDTMAGSVYAHTWRAHGWVEGARVRRVEVRAHGRALNLVAKRGGLPLDLTDPAALLDCQLVARFFSHGTAAKRIVSPGPATTPKRKRQTDPRWAAVQAAGPLAVGPLVRVPRSSTPVREACVARAFDAFARAAGNLSGWLGQDVDLVAALENARETPAFAERLDYAEARRRGLFRQQPEENAAPLAATTMEVSCRKMPQENGPPSRREDAA